MTYRIILPLVTILNVIRKYYMLYGQVGKPHILITQVILMKYTQHAHRFMEIDNVRKN